MLIEENPAAATPFEWIGGEAPVRALVDRFYDLMDMLHRSEICAFSP